MKIPMSFVQNFFSTVYSSTAKLIKSCLNYNNKRLISMVSFEQLEYLLRSRKVDPNYNEDGFNALHRVAILPLHAKKRTDLLLSMGTDVNMQADGEANNTPLHLFIATENSDMAMYLIDSAEALGARIDFTKCNANQCTVLLLAVKMRQTRLALYMLKKAANRLNVNAQDEGGMTALHYAAALGQPDLLKALIDRGADESLKNNQEQLPKDVCDYSAEKIADILSSVGIQCERDENAVLNYVHDQNRQKLYICLKGTHELKPLTISSTKKVVPRLKARLMDSHSADSRSSSPDQGHDFFVDSSALFNGRKPVPISEAGIKYVIDQLNHFSGKTLLTACQKGQVKTREYFNRRAKNIRHHHAALTVPAKMSDNTVSYSLAHTLLGETRSHHKETAVSQAEITPSGEKRIALN
jgi:hypothetical protein